MSASRRLQKELRKLAREPVAGVSAVIRDGNVRLWDIVVDGPEGSLYEGGKFKFSMQLDAEYPFKVPKCLCHTKIWHPSFSQDSEAFCGVDILLPENWTPMCTLQDVFIGIWALIGNPSSEHAFVAVVARAFAEDPAAFARKAKEYVRRYAS